MDWWLFHAFMNSIGRERISCGVSTNFLTHVHTFSLVVRRQPHPGFRLYTFVSIWFSTDSQARYMGVTTNTKASCYSFKGDGVPARGWRTCFSWRPATTVDVLVPQVVG